MIGVSGDAGGRREACAGPSSRAPWRGPFQGGRHVVRNLLLRPLEEHPEVSLNSATGMLFKCLDSLSGL